jgi:hypothetical protein
MGASGGIDLFFPGTFDDLPLEEIWQAVHRAGFFDYFEPKYVEEVDFPRAGTVGEYVSQLWLPGERQVPGTQLTVSDKASYCLNDLVRMDAEAAAGKRRGWLATLHGNVELAYVSAGTMRTASFFRSLHDWRQQPLAGILSRRFNDLSEFGMQDDPEDDPLLRFSILRMHVHRAFSGSNAGLTFGVIVDSPAFLDLKGMSHPELPSGTNMANWRRLLASVSNLASGCVAVSSVTVALRDLFRFIPTDEIVREVRALPKLDYVE